MLYLKWKSYDNLLNSWIDKRDIVQLIHKNEYFPKLHESFGGNISVKLDLFSYATKADLKGASGVDKSNLAAKSDSASLMAEVDKIDRQIKD